MIDVKELYFETQKRLRMAGIDNPAFDAAALIEKHTGLSRADIICGAKLPENFDNAAFDRDVHRRENREPLQYILKVWNFFGFDFYVGNGVLIPRQDTELLAKIAIDYLKSTGSREFIELCAGSGCLSTAILKTVENSCCYCAELSDDALFYLNKNLVFNKVNDRAVILKRDILKEETPSGISKLHPEKFSLLICNPPYIKSAVIKALEPEVKDFEPIMALDGGEDGLVFYKAMANYLPLLESGGLAAFEIGSDEGNDVADILKTAGLTKVEIKKDYAGLDRVVLGYKL